MLNFVTNSRLLLVFVIPFFLGCVSSFSFQPFNYTVINFFIFPLLFLKILSLINKLSKKHLQEKTLF